VTTANAWVGEVAAPDGASPLRRRALCWLALLGPFFFLSYGAANRFAALHAHLGEVAFGWERGIPFLAWMIVPYWSIDVFYGLSFFLCTTAQELDTLGRRLLTAQIIAVICFILFPLHFSFAHPEAHGVAGFLIDALARFDKPYNQAPSLHIALLVALWVLYARHVPRRASFLLHAWFALIGISVLTTYQHHFIDVPTGALLGFLCLYLWPEQGGSPFRAARRVADNRRRRIATAYAAGSAALTAAAFAFGGTALWLLWPAISLALVAASYGVLGVDGFQKSPDGRMSVAACALLAPYLLGAWINARLWTWRDPDTAAIRDGVSLGRLPAPHGASAFATLVDLSAELPGLSGAASCRAMPMLDLVTPAPEQLRAIAARIEKAREAGPVLVACALGYSRSVAAVATWLVLTRRAASVDDAIEQIRRVAPRIVLDAEARAAIEAAARTRR
jgi:membrane-associated phospholipid phosphatase